MITCILIDRDLPVDHFRHMDRAVILDLTYLASPAFLQVDLRHSLTDDPKIIQVRLYAVIRAAAHCDLKFMRQLDLTVTVVKPFMDFF